MVFFPGHFALAQSVLASKEISKRLSSSKTRGFWKREKNVRLRWENKTKYILRTLCIFPQGKNDEICHDLWSTPLTWAVSLIKEIGPNGEANHMIIPKVNNVTHPFFLLSNFPQGPQGHASIAHEVQGSPGWAKGSRWKYFAGVLQKREVSSLHQLILHWIFQVLKWALFLWTFFAIFFSQHTLHHTEWKLPIFHTLLWNFPGSTVFFSTLLYLLIDYLSLKVNFKYSLSLWLHSTRGFPWPPFLTTPSVATFSMTSIWTRWASRL